LEAKHIPLLESWVTDVETSIGYIRSSGMPTSCLPSHDRASRATVQFPQHRRADDCGNLIPPTSPLQQLYIG